MTPSERRLRSAMRRLRRAIADRDQAIRDCLAEGASLGRIATVAELPKATVQSIVNRLEHRS